MPDQTGTQKPVTAGLLFFYAETPMHPGTGTSLGVVDLPIQRERTTEFPIIQASSIKGVLRSEAEAWINRQPTEQQSIARQHLVVIFGPDTEKASEHAGSVTFTDARILLFPVRSMRGVFTWVTSPGILARLKRDLQLTGINADWNIPSVEDSKALVLQDCGCIADGKVVLEEYSFEAVTADDASGDLAKISKWLNDNAFPESTDFQWWRDKVAKDLIVLANDDFRDFVTLATEIIARIGLNYETKTVKGESGSGALWYEEFLPSETMMYSVTIAQEPRAKGLNASQGARGVLKWFENLKLEQIQIGGNETVGKGICRMRWLTDAK